MNIYLPIAQIEVSLLLLCSAASLAGLCMGMFGLGGGVISTPLLILIGIPTHIAVGTAPMYLFGSSFVGTLRNVAEKIINFKLAIPVAISSAVGSLVGGIIMRHLNSNDNASEVVALIYIFFMSIVCVVMVSGLLFQPESPEQVWDEDDMSNISSDAISGLKTAFLIFLGLLVGIVGSICGIGGSLIIVPLVIRVFNLSFKQAAAVSVFQVMFASFLNFLLYSISGFNDIVLGCIMIVFSTIFIVPGKYLQSKMGDEVVKFLLLSITFAILTLFLSKLFIEPNDKIFLEM